MKLSKLSVFVLMILSLALAVAAQPTIDSIGDQSVTEGEELTVDITATNGAEFFICTGNGCTADSTTATIADTDATITRQDDTAAEFSWTPDFDAASGGSYDVTVRVSDGVDSVTDSFEITVLNAAASLNVPDVALGGSGQTRSNPNHDDEDKEEVNATTTFTIENDGGETLNDLAATVEVVGFSESDLLNSITIAGDKTTLAPGETVQVTLEMRVPESLDAINEDGTAYIPVVANVRFTADKLDSSGVVAQVTMQAENNLQIDDVDITVNDADTESVKDEEDIEDIRPADDIDLEVTVENTFKNKEDVDIDDVEVVIESDDELNLDEDEEISSVQADEKESTTISFDIDEDADENDELVTLSAIGEDEFGARHGEVMEFTLQIEREPHEIQIRSIDLNPSSISCSEQVELSVSIRNTGDKDEDETFVRVVATDLSYNKVSERLDLEQDDSATRRFTIPIPDGLSSGGHRITVETFYDTSELSDRDGVVLTKTNCALDEPDRDSEDDVVVVVQPPVEDDDNDVVVAEPTPTETEQASGSFLEGPGIIALLILAYVVVIGGGLIIAIRLLRK